MEPGMVPFTAKLMALLYGSEAVWVGLLTVSGSQYSVPLLRSPGVRCLRGRNMEANRLRCWRLLKRSGVRFIFSLLIGF